MIDFADAFYDLVTVLLTPFADGNLIVVFPAYLIIIASLFLLLIKILGGFK